MITLLATFALSAAAADVEVGLGLGGALDLPDATSKTYAHRAYTGGALTVPVRLVFRDRVRLGIDLRAGFSPGGDRISWQAYVDGAPVRVYSDDHWALLATGEGLLAGSVDLAALGPLTPYIGLAGGLLWAGNYHSLGPDTGTDVVFGPENDLTDPNNIDPFTTQIAFTSELRLGGRIAVGETLAVGVETGYGSAFLDTSPLQKSAPGIDARREAFGYNPVRLGVSFHLAL